MSTIKSVSDAYRGRGLIADPIHQYIFYTRPQGSTRRVAKEPLPEILKYLPGKVAQCRIFAASHDHDPELAQALVQALDDEAPAIKINV